MCVACVSVAVSPVAAQQCWKEKRATARGLQHTLSPQGWAAGYLILFGERIFVFFNRLCAARMVETAGGHALVALFTDGSDPVHKATIVPRGGALGMVTQVRVV